MSNTHICASYSCQACKQGNTSTTEEEENRQHWCDCRCELQGTHKWLYELGVESEDDVASVDGWATPEYLSTSSQSAEPGSPLSIELSPRRNRSWSFLKPDSDEDDGYFSSAEEVPYVFSSVEVVPFEYSSANDMVQHLLASDAALRKCLPCPKSANDRLRIQAEEYAEIYETVSVSDDDDDEPLTSWTVYDVASESDSDSEVELLKVLKSKRLGFGRRASQRLAEKANRKAAEVDTDAEGKGQTVLPDKAARRMEALISARSAHRRSNAGEVRTQKRNNKRRRPAHTNA